MDWIYRFSFYQRLQFSLILFILIPIMTVSIVSYLIIENEVTQRIRQTNQQVLEVMADDLDKAIEDLTFSANLFANDINFHNALGGLAESEKLSSFAELGSYQRVVEFINLVDVKTMYVQMKLFIVNPKDFIIYGNDSYDMQEIGEEWEGLKQKIDFSQNQVMQWLGPVMNEDGTPGDYYTARVIRHKNTGDYLGTLVMGITADYMQEIFRITQSGSVILHGADGSPIAWLDERENGNGPVIANETTISPTGWRLVYQIPSDEITGKISSVFQIFVVIIGGCFLLFLISSIWLAKSLHKPLDIFKRVAEKFGAGNLAVRFPVRGKDEIATIGRTFNGMLDQIQELIINIENEQEEKRIVELQALFAQIRPHFLINTLNSIKCNLSIHGDHLHSQQIDSLMRLLRAYMKVNEPHTLERECRLIGDYLDIMRMRNDLSIELHLDLADELRALEVPRLMLQPLVENAIVHGFTDHETENTIWIRAKRQGQTIVLEVKDNGKGVDQTEWEALQYRLSVTEAKEDASRRSVGLSNVAQRIKLAFGPHSRLEVTRNQSRGMCFRLILPAD